jgi:hypothetical protein
MTVLGSLNIRTVSVRRDETDSVKHSRMMEGGFEMLESGRLPPPALPGRRTAPLHVIIGRKSGSFTIN